VTHFMSPLLNYIFFNENSDSIPDRYKKLTPKETEAFHVGELQKLTGLETYYHILNITGLRLKNDPQSTVTLVGTNSDVGPEKNNVQLSENRAKSVKNYLVNVWGINPERIFLGFRNLPLQPSAKDDPAGQEENRRVEIISDNIKIIEPVIVEDTTRTVNKTTVRFYNEIKSKTDIKSWKLSIRQNGHILKEFSGMGEVPKAIDWSISSDGADAPKKGGFISYNMMVEDKFGQIEYSADRQLPVEQMTVERKKIERKYDREYEYYSLILFDFGKYTLRKEHKKVLDYIKNRLTPESKVIITGHTDIIGQEAFNKKISIKRAEAVAEHLNIPNAQIIGEGQDNLLYSNTLPEGRFYCRTVRINIETTVINQ
ncbi:OmpA family protein, partial [Bacteroidetes/Chlorobi group bacterium ChocPot_Mid]